jgi:hypothetical protein
MAKKKALLLVIFRCLPCHVIKCQPERFGCFGPVGAPDFAAAVTADSEHVKSGWLFGRMPGPAWWKFKFAGPTRFNQAGTATAWLEGDILFHKGLP